MNGFFKCDINSSLIMRFFLPGSYFFCSLKS